MRNMTNLPTLETLQNIQNASIGYIGLGIFNSYSEDEKTQKSKQHLKELHEIQEEYREITEIANLLGMEPKAMGEIGERYVEIVDRFETLKARLLAFKSGDIEGAFIDKCLDIEKQLNEFEMRLKETSHTPPENINHLRNNMFSD